MVKTEGCFRRDEGDRKKNSKQICVKVIVEDSGSITLKVCSLWEEKKNMKTSPDMDIKFLKKAV